MNKEMLNILNGFINVPRPKQSLTLWLLGPIRQKNFFIGD